MKCEGEGEGEWEEKVDKKDVYQSKVKAVRRGIGGEWAGVEENWCHGLGVRGGQREDNGVIAVQKGRDFLDMVSRGGSGRAPPSRGAGGLE